MIDTVQIAQCIEHIKKLRDIKKDVVDSNNCCSTFIDLCDRSGKFLSFLKNTMISAIDLDSSSTANILPTENATIQNLLTVLQDIFKISPRFTHKAKSSVSKIQLPTYFLELMELDDLEERLDNCAFELKLPLETNSKQRSKDADYLENIFLKMTNNIVKAIRESAQGFPSDKLSKLDKLQSDIIEVGKGLFHTLSQCVSPASVYSDNSSNEHNKKLLISQNMQNEMEQIAICKDRTNRLAKLKVERALNVTQASLGNGSFGQVYIGCYDSMKVAVKRINIKNTTLLGAENELLTMQSLGSHPNLLACYGYTQSETYVDIILELSPLGPLSAILYNRNLNADISLPLQLAWLCDISNGLSHIHSKNVIHRDLKAENMLVFDMLRIKLCDFGLAKEHKSISSMQSSAGVGTEPFMAPEVVMNTRSTYASDIYSFGIAALQIITRKLPQPLEISLAVKSIDSLIDETLISECANIDQQCRPTAEDVYSRCLKLLKDKHGSDPRAMGHNDHNKIATLNSSVNAFETENRNNLLIAIESLDSDDALKLLIYLGCRKDLAAITSNLSVEVNGDVLKTANAVKCLQDMEGDTSDNRKEALETVLFKLRELTETGLKIELLCEIRDKIRLYSELTDNNIHDAVVCWCSNSKTVRGKYGDISKWNTSKVKNMHNLFKGQKMFNDNISQWDVSNVINMHSMFCGASSFNQPLNNWNVSNVTNMWSMFKDTSNFNQPLNNWNVSNVTNMVFMFQNAFSFNHPLDDWNVTRVSTMGCMFQGATKFNQSLNNWNVSNVTNISNMFFDAVEFNQPLNSWNVSNVTDMSQMFKHATSFNQLITAWNVLKVTNMKNMFCDASCFNQPLNDWNISNVTNMAGMFSGASKFNQPLDTWNVSNVTDMNCMFKHASNFNQALDDWNVSKVENMQAMFHYSSNFNQPLNNWDVTNVRNMLGMFDTATCFNQPLNNWNITKVTYMYGMFYNTPGFNQSLDNWNVPAHSIFQSGSSFIQTFND